MSFDLLTIDYHAQDADKQFVKSLQETGFAVIKNHPIAAKLIDHVYDEWKHFFAGEDKMNYLHDKETHSGYYPFKSENAKYTPIKDLKEFYHYRYWCELPKGMSCDTNTLYNEMNQLAGTLLSWIEANLPQDIKSGFPMPLSEMIVECKRTLIRVLNYPPIDAADHAAGAVRAAEHEDINMLTLLPAATAKGLQVKDRQGMWHDVPCDHGTIVVNSGDTLSALTQGYFKATTHRVVNPNDETAGQARLSMPLFLHPHGDIKLPDGRTAKEFWLERMRALGLI